MSYVIGPIEADDWFLLRQLRESIRFLREKNPVKYRLAIDKETSIFEEVLSKVSRRQDTLEDYKEAA